MKNQLPKILTLEEVAEMLQVSTNDLLVEINDGRLKAIRIAGDKWRITENAFLDFLGETEVITHQTASASESAVITKTPSYEIEISELAGPQQSDPFIYQWPEKQETYDEVYKSQVSVGQKILHVCIGFTNREAAGETRRRAVVFFGEQPRLTPVVEFVGTNDFSVSGKMASIIKVPSNREGGLRQLRPYEPLPKEYSDCDLVIYNHVVTGRYATGSIAVLVHKDNLSAMVNHAMIRARLKGWI